MNKPWQVCVVLIGIFAAGGISGGLVAYRVARRNAARLPTPEAWMARRFDQMARELSLTPAQKARIEPMLKRDIEELAKLRRQWFRTSREILERKEAEIAAELTPEQRTKYAQFLKERQARFRRMAPEQRGPPGADDEPPPPPSEKAPRT